MFFSMWVLHLSYQIHQLRTFILLGVLSWFLPSGEIIYSSLIMANMESIFLDSVGDFMNYKIETLPFKYTDIPIRDIPN